MTLERLRALLSRRLTADLEPAFERFQESSERPEEADAYLAFLHREGLIGETLFGELLELQEVEVTLSLVGSGQTAESSAAVARVAAALREAAPRHCAACGEAVVGGSTPELLAELGRGAMGEIHIARDAELGRRVAYKRLRPEAAAHDIIVERFLSEAQITAQLDHPNIVPVYSLAFDETDGPAYTMKLVRGQTFKELGTEILARYRDGKSLLEEQRLERRLEHFVKVCEAMHYAHSKGVLHRDLKPANIMIGRYGEVYVMDWGVASIRGLQSETSTARVDVPTLGDDEDDDATATQDGQLVGTPAYMSPEQAHGHNAELDARSDLFSLGLILYQLVTLRRGIDGSSAREVLANVRLGKLSPIEHEYGEPIAADLRDIITRATAHDRDKRYASAVELANELRRFLRGDAVRAHRYSQLERIKRYMARHGTATLMVTLLALLLCAAGLIWGLESSRQAFSERLAANQREARMQREAREREQQLGRHISRVNRNARRLDAHFKHYESLLVGYASAVRHALLHGKPSDEHVHFDAAMIQTPAARPKDMVHSKGYGREISSTQLVVKLAPGTEREAVMPTIRRLVALRPAMRQVILDSHPTRRAKTDAEQHAMIVDGKAPLVWIYVGLESGAHVSFPGKYGYPTKYDPRKRPWYGLPWNTRGAVWGAPYIDAGGQGLVLPCTHEIKDAGGRRLGVAAVELTFDYLIEALLAMPEEGAVLQTYLVDALGREIISSSERGKQVTINLDGKQAKDPPPLSIAPVREAIAGGHHDGVVTYDSAGGRRLVSFARLSSLGWYYVVVADPAAVFHGPQK